MINSIHNSLGDNQYFYTGLSEEELAAIIESYGIEETYDMPDTEIAELAGEILFAVPIVL